MIGKVLFLTMALSLSGCAVRSMESHGLRAADGLSTAYPADADRLAGDVAAELSRRYAPAQTGFTLLTVAGQFGVSLEQHLRSQGFALLPESGVMVGTVADVLQGETAPAGYVEVRTSDGQLFSLVRRLKGGSLPAPLVSAAEPVVPEPVVEAPFARPEPPSAVQSTPLLESAPQAAKPAEQAVFTPKKEQPVAQTVRTVVLPRAVLTVLPYNWRYTIPDAARRQVKVGEPQNVPWREAIRRMALESGCEARFDDSARRVTLNAVAPLPVSNPVPMATTSQVAPSQAAPVSALHPASLPESASQEPVLPAPATSQASAPTSSPAVTQALHAAATVAAPAGPAGPVVTSTATLFSTPPEPVLPAPVSPAPASPAPPLETWELEPGSLYACLGRWTERAGYQLVWKAPDDLTMQASATFAGSFADVTRQLFAGLARSGHNLRVTLYQSNNVMEVRGE